MRSWRKCYADKKDRRCERREIVGQVRDDDGGDDMSERNPWLDLAHEDYEGHMGHVDVRQLETLSRVFGEQLSLVADREKPAVAVLGIAGGNGLEHVVAGRYGTVVGLDINGEYLEICHARYGRLSELTLHQWAVAVMLGARRHVCGYSSPWAGT